MIPRFATNELVNISPNERGRVVKNRLDESGEYLVLVELLHDNELHVFRERELTPTSQW